MTTASRVMAPAPRKVQACPFALAVAADRSRPVCGGHGVRVTPAIVSGGVVGPVAKHTSPLMIVCGDVLELVKVLETTP